MPKRKPVSTNSDHDDEYEGGDGDLRAPYNRHVASKIASSKMYTANGEPIRNLESYLAAGGRPRTSNGQIIHDPVSYRNSIEASVRQNTTDPKYLHHYTDDAGADGITTSGTIQASSTGLAGEGTYLTGKQPRCHSSTLLDNNYGAGNAARDRSFVDHVVRLDADNLNAEYVSGSSGRDVWKVNGDVNLKDHNATIRKR